MRLYALKMRNKAMYISWVESGSLVLFFMCFLIGVFVYDLFGAYKCAIIAF